MAFALSCPPFISSAATYYVNPETGNDSNAGTVDAPFKTVNKGFSFINESDNRGSELIIAPGKYQLTSAIGCNGGGSEAKRSHVRSSTGKPEDVVIYSDGTFECLRLGSFITISGITFSNGVNSATCPSGGIRFSEHNDSAYRMIVSNCVVTCCNNAYGTGTNGAAVAIYGHNLMIDSVIRNNRASMMNGAGVLIMNNDTFKGVPRLERCRIEGNVATGKGGGVYVATSPRSTTYTSTGNSVEIIDCEIIGNSASDGAGVYFAIANLTANLTGCVISNNTATTNSGGIRLENSGIALWKTTEPAAAPARMSSALVPPLPPRYPVPTRFSARTTPRPPAAAYESTVMAGRCSRILFSAKIPQAIPAAGFTSMRKGRVGSTVAVSMATRLQAQR